MSPSHCFLLLVFSLEFGHRSYTDLGILVKHISGVKSLKTPRFEPFPSVYTQPRECAGTELPFSEPSVADGWVLVGTIFCPWHAWAQQVPTQALLSVKALVRPHGSRPAKFPRIRETFGQTSILIYGWSAIIFSPQKWSESNQTALWGWSEAKSRAFSLFSTTQSASLSLQHYLCSSLFSYGCTLNAPTSSCTQRGLCCYQ